MRAKYCYCFSQEGEFKKVWIDLAWENKLCQQYAKINLFEFYTQFVKLMGFYTVSKVNEEEKNCSILGVNLYGKSKFGIFIIKGRVYY